MWCCTSVLHLTKAENYPCHTHTMWLLHFALQPTKAENYPIEKCEIKTVMWNKWKTDSTELQIEISGETPCPLWDTPSSERVFKAFSLFEIFWLFQGIHVQNKICSLCSCALLFPFSHFFNSFFCFFVLFWTFFCFLIFCPRLSTLDLWLVRVLLLSRIIFSSNLGVFWYFWYDARTSMFF